jgi:SAM-dependent methyltransferase
MASWASWREQDLFLDLSRPLAVFLTSMPAQSPTERLQERAAKKIQKLDAILSKLGVTDINKNAQILDYGCGAGHTVYTLLDQGYSNVAGFDISDYLALRGPADRKHFYIADTRAGIPLPFEDNRFDLIISEQVFEHVKDQVGVFRELHRVMRVGGHAIHTISPRYFPLEEHSFVPVGNWFAHRWWYKFWAIVGIRNSFQKGLSADETADRNAFYFVDALNYVPSSCYKVVWEKLGFDYKFLAQESLDTNRRSFVRVVGRLNRVFPVLGWLFNTFVTRRVYLRKRASSAKSSNPV